MRKAAMHSQRSRIENAGGNAFAGDWCHYAGARVHGGKHVSGPENQEQHAGNDQRHEDKEVGDCSDLHVSEPFAWVVMEDAIKNRQNGFDQPGHGAGDVVHLGIRFLALRCFDQLRHEQIRTLHLYVRRNAPRGPVVDALNSAVFVIAQQLSNLCRSAKRLDKCFVIHGVLNTVLILMSTPCW